MKDILDPIQDIKQIKNTINEIANLFNLPVFYVKDNYTPTINKTYRGCILMYEKKQQNSTILNVCFSYKPDITCDDFVNLFFSIRNRLVKTVGDNVSYQEIFYLDKLSIIGGDNINISQSISLNNLKHLPKELKHLSNYHDIVGIITNDNIVYLKTYLSKTVKKFINLLEKYGEVLSKYSYDKKSIFKKIWLEFKLNRLIR